MLGSLPPGEVGSRSPCLLTVIALRCYFTLAVSYNKQLIAFCGLCSLYAEHCKVRGEALTCSFVSLASFSWRSSFKTGVQGEARPDAFFSARVLTTKLFISPPAESVAAAGNSPMVAVIRRDMRVMEVQTV